MRHILRMIIASFWLFCLALGPAAADSSGRDIKTVIRGVGDQLRLAKELPDTKPFQLQDGRFFDLGYLYKWEATGKWIGKIPLTLDYVDLSDSALKKVMRDAGIKELPAIPPRIVVQTDQSSDKGLFMRVLASILQVLGAGLALFFWTKSSVSKIKPPFRSKLEPEIQLSADLESRIEAAAKNFQRGGASPHIPLTKT